MKNKKLILSDELVKKIMKTAYFMALKILKNEADAEDIASDAMLTILEKSEELKDEKAFEAWANRIVVNKCYNHIKKMKPVLCGDYGPEFLDGAQLEEYNVEFLPEEYAVNEEEGSEITMETGIFNKDIPSDIFFQYTSKSLDKSMEVAEAFLVYMGLGEYAEDLLHSKGIVHIKTENKLSEYDVESNMYVSSYYETYTFRVSVKYSDWEFESNDNIEHIKPTKLEIFDEHHKLTDYMGKSEFDNTTLRGLVGRIHFSISKAYI